MNKELIVQGTQIRKHTRGYFLAIIHPSMRQNIKGIRENQLILVNREFENRIFSIPALLQVDETIPSDTVLIDQTIREALMVNKGEKVFLSPFIHKKGPSCTRLINKLFGIQTNIVCIKLADKTDMELPLCRITPQTMETIGVQSGDTIIIQGIEKSMRMTVYALTEEIINRRLKTNPDDEKTPLSWIMIDYDARQELGIKKDDPVMIYRDLNYMVRKKVHLLSEPLVLTIIGTILGFNLSFNWQVAVLSLGLFLVIIFNFIGIRKK